jgi:hypothetical protein
VPGRTVGAHSVPSVQVTLAEFRLAVALVSSRTLAVRAMDGEVAIKYMVPLMDMANHRQGSMHQASGTEAVARRRTASSERAQPS